MLHVQRNPGYHFKGLFTHKEKSQQQAARPALRNFVWS